MKSSPLSVHSAAACRTMCQRDHVCQGWAFQPMAGLCAFATRPFWVEEPDWQGERADPLSDCASLDEVGPSSAAHAMWTGSKAGETVYLLHRVHRTLLDALQGV